MSATDELRRMLDERGVEWRGGLPTETIVREPIDALYVERSDGRMHVYFRSYLTPTQAITATLGAGTCHMEQTGHVKVAGVDYYDDDYECSECSVELFEGYNFCPNCGKRVVDE